MPRKLVSAALVVALLLAIISLLVLLRPRHTATRKNGPTPILYREGSATPGLGSPSLPIADPSAYVSLNTGRTNAEDDVRIVDGIIVNFRQLLKGDAVPPLGFNEESNICPSASRSHYTPHPRNM